MENTAEIPSRQEMYDRAYRGLAGQDWERVTVNGHCAYLKVSDGRILRCAWGHVDPEETGRCADAGNVFDLAWAKVGLAGRLSEDDLMWADELQGMHDGAGFGREREGCPVDMEERFHWFAAKHGLVIPQL